MNNLQQIRKCHFYEYWQSFHNKKNNQTYLFNLNVNDAAVQCSSWVHFQLHNRNEKLHQNLQ